MNYEVTYHRTLLEEVFPTSYHLNAYLRKLVRLAPSEEYSPELSKDNIYFLRTPSGEMEFFTNVGIDGRWDLLVILTNFLLEHDIKPSCISVDDIDVFPNISKEERYDDFCDIIVSTLPSLCEGRSYLDSSILFVLHADERRADGTLLPHHIHRVHIHQ